MFRGQAIRRLVKVCCLDAYASSSRTRFNSLTDTPELETLLAVIGTAWQGDKPLAVRKLLIREELGSPATIHKRIHQLKDAGFVSFEGQEGDSRVRLVVPTEQALRYFAEHAKVIQQAAK